MKYVAKPILAALLMVTIAALTACTLGQAAEATPTAVDVNAVVTSAAATAFAQLTEYAAQATPTTAPTDTPSPTLTQTQPAGETPGGAATTATIEITVQLTNTPDLAIGGNPTTMPGLGTLPAVTLTVIPSLTAAGSTGNAANPGPVCKNAVYLEDLTVPDNTEFQPWEKFYKVWRMQNNGVCRWDEGFSFQAWAGPPSMTAHPYKITQSNQFVEPGASMDVGINMYAPGDAGTYTANWSWYDDNNQPFGQSVTVVIKVVK